MGGCSSSTSAIATDANTANNNANGDYNDTATRRIQSNEGRRTIEAGAGRITLRSAPERASQVSEGRRRSGGGRLFSRRNRPTEEERAQRELDEVQALQRELLAMEAFFQTLLGQAYEREVFGGLGEAVGAPPPASETAVRRLPTIRVAPEDLVDESNRQCCICYGENNLGDTVTRLPCGHLYHRPCVSKWLEKHCTCPVCRYELPTDDAQYERGRKQRMKERKPRYRRYELDRMRPHDLRDLAFNRLGMSGQNVPVEKVDLVDRIISSGMVDIVETPDPVEYKLSGLRAMGVAKLKKAMCEAGVFFEPGDVVEKEDMVQLFINSGRLMILPEEKGNDMGESLVGSEELGDGDAGSIESDQSEDLRRVQCIW